MIEITECLGSFDQRLEVSKAVGGAQRLVGDALEAVDSARKREARSSCGQWYLRGLDQDQRDRVVLGFLRARERYLRLANFLRGLLEDDPTLPAGTIYAIRQRLKNEGRLIEKIEDLNKVAVDGPAQISPDNFADHIDDLLGLRVVCLLPSDVGEVDELIRSLSFAGRITFVRPPQLKRTFDIPLNPKERDATALDLQYSGYASNHYVVEPGSNAALPGDLVGLRAEIQSRTIFEEAWGELDHPRYELARSGRDIPLSLKRGFYVLSAQLATCAVSAEYLSEELRSVSASAVAAEAAAEARAEPVPAPPSAVPMLEPVTYASTLLTKFGFNPSARTFRYMQHRFLDHTYINRRQPTVEALAALLSDETLARFRALFAEVMGGEPFTRYEVRDNDALIAVNFAISRDRNAEIAEQRLLSILRDRKRREADTPALFGTDAFG